MCAKQGDIACISKPYLLNAAKVYRAIAVYAA